MPSTDNQSELGRMVHVIVCRILGLDDEDHEDDEIAKPLEDEIIAHIQTHDTKLYEQVMGAMKEAEPNWDYFDDYNRTFVQVMFSGFSDQLRTAINKIFNKEV